ncbi:nucleotidyltransferase domain-containing protein [bacterium]|nr:nucleotidyltransferase domain-containing protein [bacterium]
MDQRLHDCISRQPYPLLFVTMSGAHLYGFPSADSDYDLRGVHLLPLTEIVGLNAKQETIEVSEIGSGLQIDLVTHDARKFFQLLLKRNGYVLEQLYSPLVLHSTAEYLELKEIAQGCLTRHHSHHYLGFADAQWRLFNADPKIKTLLYLYRVLLTGIHLMTSGTIEANLLKLNEEFRLPYIQDLVAFKVSSQEQARLTDADISFHHSEYLRLRKWLEASYS